MRDFLFFLGGAVFMLWFVFGVLRLERWRCERDHPRGGYIDLTGTHPHIERRTASAEPYDAELSGGLTSQPPSHLRIVKGEKE